MLCLLLLHIRSSLTVHVSFFYFFKMSQKIEELENAALAEKPWQLLGEVTAQTRPENSMLEEDVEFEQASRAGG